jgi:outer membrane protein assembly factor BamB
MNLLRRQLLPTLLVLGLLTACSNPWLASAPPPQPGTVLYALAVRWDKPIHSSTDLASANVTLTAEAMRSADGRSIWQTAMLSGAGVASVQGAAIIAAGSTIFVTVAMPAQGGHHGQAMALDAHSGHVLWRTTLDGASIWRSVAANGNLYLEVDGRVEALDGSSGSRLWSAAPVARYQTDEVVVTSSAVYVESAADFLPAAQGNTYSSAIVRALRVRDGTAIWRREVASTITDQLISLVHVSIQADERTVYVLREGQVMETHGNVSADFPRWTLFALNARDGSSRWSNPTQRSEEGGRQFSLALFNQALYVVGVANPGINTLTAFQSQDGKQLRSWQTPFIISPFAPPNHIYGSSITKGESFCALRESDGSIAWCADYNQAGPALFSHGKVYLYAFEITYQGTSFSEQPARLYVLNESDGSLASHYSLGDETRMNLMSLALS